MFKTKKDLDAHVRSQFAKIRSETDRNLRSFTIAKCYAKIGEYATAEHYVSAFLSAKKDSAPAHKFLGQCYQRLNKPDKALASFQQSLQLDPKQQDLLTEVCKLLLADNALNPNTAKYWCDLAESERVQDDAVFSLRLKLLNKDNLETKQVEEFLLREIASRPYDPNLRVRLLRHYIDENQIQDAFKYAFNLEMNNQDVFANCAEWYNVVWLVLSKYEQQTSARNDWEFWLFLIICLERQVVISFSANKSLPNEGTTETANLLFNFDQYLFKASQVVEKLSSEKELAIRFLNHYRGQLCLHAVALIFKRELVQNKNQWREAIKTSLPLLLLAWQAGNVDTQERWIKHCSEKNKQLLQLWNREGAFRCAQVGRTLLSCIDDNKENTTSNQVNQILLSPSTWASADDLIAQVRQSCSDPSWRRSIFGMLFCNSDQKIKDQTSYLLQNDKCNELLYELPIYADVETYEEIAQYFKPQSLLHMVYLCLGRDNLDDVRCKFYKGLNFSTQNLAFCGAESLNQLDIETFLYGCAIQAKRQLEVEKNAYENFNTNGAGKPFIMPFVNLQANLCTEEQINWWTSAYQVYKNLANDNLAELRATLQYGIEAVRGVNGPKIDLIIIFKLGKIFVARTQEANKPIERSMLEMRVENLYKYGLNIYKIHKKNVLEPFRKLFKYANANSSQVERELNALVEDAVTHLAAKMLKKAEFEECIEQLNDIPLPFATYFLSEAYRQLDESNKTPKKNKRVYLEKARDCLNQTLNLLSSTDFDPSHPLNSIINSEIKRVQYTNRFLQESNGRLNTTNSSTYEDAEPGDYLNDTPIYQSMNRSRREVSFGAAPSPAPPRISELENLCKQMASTLSFLKEELVDTIKPEVTGLRKEIAQLKDKIAVLEENLNRKKSNPPSRDEGSTNPLDDLYIIEDELQNYASQQNLYGSFGQHGNSSTAPRMHTPNQAATAAAAMVSGLPPHHPQANPYNSPLYNYNYFQGQYMMPPGAHPSAAGMQLGQRNSMVLPYMDPALQLSMMNPLGQTPSLAGLLSQNLQQQPPQLPPPQQFQPTPSLPVSQTPPTFTSTPAANLPLKNPSMGTFNKILNNTPVEKGPPVNVVITNSDPLPTTTPGAQSQPTLSVTIPPHHIKPSLVPNDVSFGHNTQTTPVTFDASPLVLKTPPTAFSFMQPSTDTSNVSQAPAAPFSFKPTETVAPTPTFGGFKPPAESASTPAFSFKPSAPTTSAVDTTLNRTSESVDSDVNTGDAEYDPRPDFKPIIPLPDEIEVKTGEEDEEVLFCARAKLFRHVDKEWKERGIGDMKILKNKEGKTRILMRRDQVKKICANHQITGELKLTKHAKEERGYIWAANDFADEVLTCEKFFVRFKEPETAKQFFNVFTKACDEAKCAEAQPEPLKEVEQAPVKSAFTLAANKTSTPAVKAPEISQSTAQVSTVSKTLFGGANQTNGGLFSGNKEATTVNKPSPFANFSFDKTTTADNTPKPFANIFGNLNKTPTTTLLPTPSAEPVKKDENLNKSVSDAEDEYVPTAQFQPVIPLPDEIEVKTGEENEIVLYEHRAKLLRHDKTANEWKERGLGNIKLLQDKDDVNKVRMVMRREVIHKLCCNQRLYKDTTFKYPKKSQNALMWVGQDYSENELSVETLSLRFKTPEICESFLQAVLKAQEKMSSDAESGNAEKKTTEETKTPKGFGDAFKPKAGSWNCDACYTSNKPDVLYCVACEGPKDPTVPKKEPAGVLNLAGDKPKTTFSFGFPAKTSEAPKGFGDAFKPKAGSWNCEACYTNNKSEVLYCVSCEGPKDSSVPKKEPVGVLNLTGDKPKTSFTFGFAPKATGPSDFSEQFNLVVGTANIQKKNDKPSATTKPETVGFGDKFKPAAGSWDCSGCYVTNSSDAMYCIACDSPKDSTLPKKETKSILAQSSSAPKFSFGFATSASTAAATTTNTFAFNFGSSGGALSNGTAPTISFSTPSILGDKNSTTVSAADSTTAPAVGSISKPSFSFTLGTKPITVPATSESESASPFSIDKKDFSFTFKPKSPGKAKSPLKGGNTSGVEDDEDDDACVEEENNTYFTPVIPLPDKIEVRTGEEDEDVLYCHRAKLYRFTDSEWKERGLGDVKILRHKQTKKTRVVMRREQVLKICLNHALNSDVEYKPKDEKSWMFVVNDFSEGEVELMQFSLRFKTKEIAEQFMVAVKAVLSGGSVETDVDISAEDKQVADRLQLPYKFFAKAGPQCAGCRGCDPDSFVFPDYKSTPESNETDNPLPLDVSVLALSKANNASIVKQSSFSFASPLKPSSLSTASPLKAGDSNEPKSTFGGGANTFSFSQALGSISSAAKDEKNVSGGFLFGGAAKFDATTDKSKPFSGSIFGNSLAKPAEDRSKSLFSVTSFTDTSASKPTSVFGNNIFGSSSTFSSNTTPIFGTSTTAIQSSDSSKSGGLFKDNGLSFASLSGQSAPTEDVNKNTSQEPIFKNSGMDFASLAKASPSTGTSTFKTVENSAGGFFGLTNTDDFKSFQKAANNDSRNANVSAASQDGNGNDDENYDPHYEPIIAMPEEIQLSTGEEEEIKLFGERATLFRYDNDTKEWKEKGVGELKILHHPSKGTYRLIMRREQIFKLVLNHAITDEMKLSMMGKSPKAFLWGAMNFAEEPPIVERLAARFATLPVAQKFEAEIKNVIEQLKSRADLEPEED